MKDELLKYHTEELKTCRDGLYGWQAAPDYDPKCKREHIATFEDLVDFHERAVTWLTESPNA